VHLRATTSAIHLSRTFDHARLALRSIARITAGQEAFSKGQLNQARPLTHGGSGSITTRAFLSTTLIAMRPFGAPRPLGRSSVLSDFGVQNQDLVAGIPIQALTLN